jgi:predicted  nucleic acid-binding Zn-ribbon protein
MDEKEQKDQLQSLERDKERMIRQYLALQDQADAVNERIYHVCCDIEALNVRIAITQEVLRRAALKASPVNGSAAPPTNGKAHC